MCYICRASDHSDSRYPSQHHSGAARRATHDKLGELGRVGSNLNEEKSGMFYPDNDRVDRSGASIGAGQHDLHLLYDLRSGLRIVNVGFQGVPVWVVGTRVLAHLYESMTGKN